jgi:hypothetical protein
MFYRDFVRVGVLLSSYVSVASNVVLEFNWNGNLVSLSIKRLNCAFEYLNTMLPKTSLKVTCLAGEPAIAMRNFIVEITNHF